MGLLQEAMAPLSFLATGVVALPGTRAGGEGHTTTQVEVQGILPAQVKVEVALSLEVPEVSRYLIPRQGTEGSAAGAGAATSMEAAGVVSGADRVV